MRNAEGGTRTPMPFRAQRPERCVSTNFTTSAGVLWTGIILLYHLRVVKCFCSVFLRKNKNAAPGHESQHFISSSENYAHTYRVEGYISGGSPRSHISVRSSGSTAWVSSKW